MLSGVRGVAPPGPAESIANNRPGTSSGRLTRLFIYGLKGAQPS